jgi:UvrB/uvrC motif
MVTLSSSKAARYDESRDPVILDGEENVVKQDIDFVLDNWEYKSGIAQARLVQAHDGRQVIQLRIDLGVLQLETTGRPDGARPHGHATYFDYLQEQVRSARKAERNFALSEEQCQDADREFLQFYHRRMCWLALRQYNRAMGDADHTLAFMDFVKRHAPNEEYLDAHEQYRGFVLFQRTQASAALQVENNAPEEAINEIRLGLDRIRAFFAADEREEEMEEDGMVQHLRHVESTLRKQYQIGATLEEQLQQAIADEDYERAARLRDKLKKRE